VNLYEETSENQASCSDEKKTLNSKQIWKGKEQHLSFSVFLKQELLMQTRPCPV
jgi:hypothetical protein